MNIKLLGCEQCYLFERCPVLNKSECPINKLWQGAQEMDEAKAILLAEAEKIIREVSEP